MNREVCSVECPCVAAVLQAIDDMIAKDADILDLGEFPNGMGIRDPYERGYTQGMKMARQALSRARAS